MHRRARYRVRRKYPLLALVGEPRKLVAIELGEEPVEALSALLERRRRTEVIRTFYGVDQGDRSRVAAIMADELGEEPLDVVIDDASHRLEETRSSFETLFPRLRPNGLYVIEDWNWQLRLGCALAGRTAGAHAADDVSGTDAVEMLDAAGPSGRAALRAYVQENISRRPLETLAL